jgi:hypothetical protein
MQLSTQGFADGFLNGFRTMADYQSQQKANERADRSMALQEQEAKDNKDYRDKSWNHMVDREGVLDVRYTEELGYNRSRQKNIDALNEKQTLASIANQNAQTGIAKARLDIDKQQAKQQKKLTDLALQEKEKQLWAEDNSGLLLGGWKNISSGQPLTEQQAEALNDPRAGAMNINKYADKTYVSAAAGLKSSVTNIMANYKPDQFHSQEFYNQLNSPEIKQQMDVVFRDEVKKGVGYIDDSGKKVVDKKFAGIVPMKDGSLALEVTPVYEDGTSGEAKPVTVNRSNDPNDQVKTFSPADIVGVINTRANMANAVKNPDTLLQDIGVVQKPDPKGYAKAVADIDSDTQKNISQILRNSANDPMANKEEVKQQVADERTAGEARKTEYKKLYGLADVASPQNDSDQQQSDIPAKLVTEWVGGDPAKQQYLQRLISSGRITKDTADTVLLDQQYQAYQKEQKNQSLEQAALNHKPK